MEDKIKYLSIEFLFILLLCLYVGRPALMFVHIDPRANPVGTFLYIIPTAYMYYRYGLRLNTKIITILGLYSLWVVAHFFIDHNLQWLTYVQVFIHILVAYTIIQVYHSDVYRYFWRAVFLLTAIDSVLWILMQIIGPDTIAQFGIITPAARTSTASFLIFNTPNITFYEGEGLFGLTRNCGFAWEPGLYGSILVLAIFCNLAEKDYQLRNNYSLYILTFGLLTTFSTTAYCAVIGIMIIKLLFELRQGVTYSKIAGALILVSSIFVVNTLPFMQQKISSDINMENMLSTEQNAVSYLEKEEKTITVQRTEGLMLDLLNYKESWIWGYGFNRANSFVYQNISPFLTTSNDLTSFLARWGTLFGAFFIFGLIWSSRFLRQRVLYDDNSILAIYLLIAVSYSLTLCALVIAMLLYRVLEDEEYVQLYDQAYAESLVEDYDELERVEDEDQEMAPTLNPAPVKP